MMDQTKLKDAVARFAKQYSWAGKRLYLEAVLEVVENAIEQEDDPAGYLFRTFLFGSVEQVREEAQIKSFPAEIIEALAVHLADADGRLSLDAAVEAAEEAAIKEAIRFVAAAAVAMLAMSPDDDGSFEEE